MQSILSQALGCMPIEGATTIRKEYWASAWEAPSGRKSYDIV